MERALRVEEPRNRADAGRPLRIGIDGGCLANRRGFGRFARELIQALARETHHHRLVVLVDRPSLDSGAVAIPDGFEVQPVAVRVAPSQAASSDGRRSLRDLLAMRRAAASAQVDLFYFPATYSYFPVRKVPKVVTVFDTMALDYPRQIFPNWRGRLAWTVKEHIAVRRASHVVTVSEASRRSIEARLRVPANRISVVPCAPSEVFYPRPETSASGAVLSRYGLAAGARYFLYVGGLSPHKNLIRLIEAFSRLHDHEVRLVLVGDLGDVFHTHVPELRAAVSEHRLEGRVIFPGFVPDPDLAHFYSRAIALVQPSLIEGFGLPPVEAMACGTPVLASSAGSLPEVVGDAGRLFDPLSVWSMTSELARLLADPESRADLADRALARARTFTWTATARGVLNACETVAARRSPGARSSSRPHLFPNRRASAIAMKDLHGAG
jgi:glycosyltransferase involved in cell wall biosynthesis